MAASTYLAQVQQLYIAYFGRPADPIGLQYWATQIDAANGSIAAVQAGFSASAESQALFGNKSTIDKVTAIYQNAFGRAPEPAGLAYWVAQLDSGKVTQAQASWTIQQSAGPGDAAAVQNKLTAAQAFTANVDTTAEIQGYQGANAAASARAFLATVTADNATATAAVNNAQAAVTAAAVGTPGSSFVLTTGIDALVGTGNNDTFTGVYNGAGATSNTLNAGDSIDGGAGVDTLKVIVTSIAAGGAPLAGVAITNVEKLSVQNIGGNAAVVNVAPIAGVTTVTSLNSTSAVNFQNLATGTEVIVSGSGANQGAVTFNQATVTDAVKVTLNGGVTGVNVASVNAITGLIAGTATSAAINSTGGANSGTLTLTGGTGTLTSLSVNADSSLNATLAAGDFAALGAALTVTGGAAVNLGSNGVFKTIDASANAGGLTVGLNALTSSFKGGAGADFLTGTAKVAATAVIDGGAGVNTVAATLINSSNAAVFKNFQVLDLTGAGAGSTATAPNTLDASLLTGSTITGVSLSGAQGGAGAFILSNLVENAGGFNVNVTGNSAGSLTLGFTAASVAGTADVLNYNFNAANGINGNAGTVTSNGIETINISSKGGVGSVNSLTVVDNAVKSIVVTGDHQLTLNVSAQTGTSTLTSIDASATTGGALITVNAATDAQGVAGNGIQSALTIKGGSGVDTITVATSAGVGSVGAIVTTGAGNDTINVAAATAQLTNGVTQFTTITDFAKGDVLAFGAGTTGTAAIKVDASVATSLASALTTAFSTAAGSAAGAVSWFNYGGDTYVVDHVTGGAALNATDVVVKLSGTLDLSHATLAAGNLTFA